MIGLQHEALRPHRLAEVQHHPQTLFPLAGPQAAHQAGLDGGFLETRAQAGIVQVDDQPFRIMKSEEFVCDTGADIEHHPGAVRGGPQAHALDFHIGSDAAGGSQPQGQNGDQETHAVPPLQASEIGQVRLIEAQPRRKCKKLSLGSPGYRINLKTRIDLRAKGK